MASFTFTPVKDPLTWDEIVQVVKTGNWEAFSRTQTCLDDYLKWRIEVLEEYVTVADHLKIKVLNYTAQTHPTTQKLHAIQPSNPSDRVLRTNEFPYSTAPEGEITHYVLWSLNEMTEKDVETTLIEQLPEHEFIHFVNPPHRKTVPEIHHWHVFARRIKRN